jgi:hypothetical protein
MTSTLQISAVRSTVNGNVIFVSNGAGTVSSILDGDIVTTPGILYTQNVRTIKTFTSNVGAWIANNRAVTTTIYLKDSVNQANEWGYNIIEPGDIFISSSTTETTGIYVTAVNVVNKSITLSSAVTVMESDQVGFLSYPVQLNSNVTIQGSQTVSYDGNAFTGSATTPDVITVEHLTASTGLWGSTTIQAYFMQFQQSYSPESDPRLPKHNTTTIDILPTDNHITVANIALFPDPGFIFATGNVVANTVVSNTLLIPLTSLGGIEVGQAVVTANIGLVTSDLTQILQNSTVNKIYRANSSILVTNITANAVVSQGETVYFYPITRLGSVRIGQEVIQYNHSWSANSTLTEITRNVGNTSPTTYPNVANTIPAGTLITALGTRILNLKL